MKLSELHAKFVCEGDGRHGMGIVFDCPVHRDHRLMVGFVNPIDGGTPMLGQRYLWQRAGDTVDTLTLGPSVDASGIQHHSSIGDPVGPCWHGSITNGEAT